jgi:aspartyl-tRNA(Asn)/glutamyl-tRNA(Gln) amidotransferase subunit C
MERGSTRDRGRRNPVRSVATRSPRRRNIVGTRSAGLGLGVRRYTPRMPVEIDIEHVARLARLELTNDEMAQLREQLGAILDHAAKVGEVAADDVPPTAYAIPRSNVLRPDEIRDSLDVEDVLANAPDREDDRFKVPRIVEVE